MSVKVYIPKDSGAVSVGSDEIAKQVLAEANKRNQDVEVVRTGSRGLFWLEPLVEVATSNGRVGYGPVAPKNVSALFDDGFLRGEPHALGVGLVEDIPFLAKQNRLLFSRVGIADPLDLKVYQQFGGFDALSLALKMAPQKIIAKVLNSGLRGRGGAGFPAGIKWKTVAEQNAAQKFICCNADEGDSGTYADRMLMEGDPFSLLEGMIIAAIATGASKGYIYVRSEYPTAISALQSAILTLNSAGWLGNNIQNSGYDMEIIVRRGAGSYVCGEESAMLESLEGKRGQVRVKPPIPAISGLFGKPTLVHNVLTLVSVLAVLSKGEKSYAQLGVGKSLGTQAFQLAGNVKNAGLIEVPFGIGLRELIEDFGGGTASGRPFKCAQIGGPLGAYIDASQLDIAMDYESLAGAGAMLGHGGIVVFDDQIDMSQMARFAFEFCSIESCGKCTPCRIGAVRGVETIDKIIAGNAVEENLVVLNELCNVMEEGSLCAMGGLTPLPVLSALKLFPQDFGLSPDATEIGA